MQAGKETTFSIFVYAFTGGAENAVRALSEVFGIGADAAASLIERAPVRVKKGIGPGDARLLARQLLAIGAELSIRNEQTGEERRYPVAGRPATSEPPSILGPIPTEQNPNVTQMMAPPGGYVPLGLPALTPTPPPAFAGLGSTVALPSPMFAPDVPGAPAPGPEEGDSASLLVPPGVPSSMPPPDAPHLRGPIVKCQACARFIEKGERCNHCGWDNAHKKRYCAGCGKDGFALSAGLGIPAWGGFIALGMLLAAAGYWFVGAAFAAAALLLPLSVGLIVDGVRIRPRCTGCKRKLNSSWLMNNERKPLQRARVKWIAYGAAFVVMSVGIAAFASTSHETDLYIASFGIGYRAKLPFTHSGFKRLNLAVDSPYGLSRVTAVVSTNHRQPVHTLALLQLVLPRETAPSVDDALLEGLLKATVTKLVPDAKFDKSEPKQLGDAPGREFTFKGNYEGSQVFGKVRGFKFTQHEIALTLVLASSQEGASSSRGKSFLESLELERKTY